MFGIGVSELFVVAFVIILFVKPEDIPKVFRTLGKIAGKAKAAYNEVLEIKDQIVKEIDEAADFEEKAAAASNPPAAAPDPTPPAKEEAVKDAEAS
jgi:sec-independent protein translocase protein TatB